MGVHDGRTTVKKLFPSLVVAVTVIAGVTAVLLWMGSPFAVLALGVGLFVIGSIVEPTLRPEHAARGDHFSGGNPHIGPYGDVGGGGGGGDSGGAGC